MKYLFQRKNKKIISVVLLFSLILQSLFIFPASVYAATSPWTQTNWAGGSGQTAWSDTTKFDSSSNVDTTTTSGQTTLSVAEKLTNSGFTSDNSSWSVAAVPSSGWVEVPGNSTYSTTNFLSMKYEAKNVGGVATSQVASTPYVSISQTSAITACSALGSSYHLISNNEWMTIARNAEAQGGNWYGGVVGTNFMFSGHNDNGPASALAASADDTLGYTGTNDSTSSCDGVYSNFVVGDDTTSGRACVGQKRTFALSNGSTLWDIAGNVWEWTNNTIQGKDQPTGSTPGFGWREFTALTTYGTMSYDLVRPLGSSYDATKSVGRIYSDGTGTNTTTYAFIRGGSWDDGAYAGAFALGLDNTPSGTDAYFGFRCASDPVAISQSFSSSSGRSAAGGNSVTIGSVSDGKVYQSINVGDTSTYNLTAYVYNNTAGSVGGTVDTNVAQLYYGGNTISSTAWTPVSGETGWYKLTGTVTGVASGVDTGVLVKAGKTIIVDDVSLSKEYNSSGTLTSSIFDSEFTIGAAWGTLTYSSSGSTVAVKARTSNSSSMSGATAFSSCNAITSSSDISSNNCVTDSHRYIQYQLALSTSDTSLTPTFSDISIGFATFDADAPSISLTALTPDPNSDNTPTLSGTATESVGTVSNVQFQMDSTSGSWTACTASDGSFNSASEAFSCTAATLTDGSHTMYVRATDSNSNTTSNANVSTDTFTIDATTPVSIDLDSPGDNSYTNSERPTYKWKATTDATAGLSKYKLEVDNGDSGDFSIDDIPTSRTTDYETNKYTIHYENFSDSDSTNNYISVYTKSHSDWGSSENDGKLREGRVSWKVKAVDNASNETSSSRTIFVDRSNPNVEFTQINSAPYTSNNFSTTDKTPTLFGKITDPLAGADSKVASGPKEINIKIEKKTGLTYSLVTLYKINMDNPYYTCESDKTIDNSKQKCDKYLPFSYTPENDLDLGQYKITLSGKDKADNSSSETTLTLNITILSQITTPQEKKIIEEGTKTLKPEEKEKIKQELEVTKPTEQVPVSALEKAGQNITQASKNFFDGLGSLTHNVITGIGNGIAFVFDKTGQGLALTTARNGIANLAFAIGEKTDNVSHGFGTAIIKIGYLFVPEPTRIVNVKIAKSTPTSMTVTWETNHPANGKVNYGLTADYGQDIQSDKRITKHEFTVTGLKPNTTYFYEVMSQNRNYVYDANHTFTTPAK